MISADWRRRRHRPARYWSRYRLTAPRPRSCRPAIGGCSETTPFFWLRSGSLIWTVTLRFSACGTALQRRELLSMSPVVAPRAPMRRAARLPLRLGFLRASASKNSSRKTAPRSSAGRLGADKTAIIEEHAGVEFAPAPRSSRRPRVSPRVSLRARPRSGHLCARAARRRLAGLCGEVAPAPAPALAGVSAPLRRLRRRARLFLDLIIT